MAPLTKPMKKTNPRQFERLVQLMKENVNIARGIRSLGMSKFHVKQKWKEIGTVLNALGPPTRVGHEWQRVWLDMKGKVKKILDRNMREGGSQFAVQSLSPLQREVDELLQLSTAIKLEDLSDERDPINTSPSPSFDHVPVSGIESVATDEPFRSFQASGGIKRKQHEAALEDERYALLRKQTKLMQQSVMQMAVLGENVAKLVGALNQQTLVLKHAVKLLDKHMEQRQ